MEKFTITQGINYLKEKKSIYTSRQNLHLFARKHMHRCEIVGEMATNKRNPLILIPQDLLDEFERPRERRIRK